MKVLVSGGSACGKSSFAEKISSRLNEASGAKKMMYLATLDKNSGGDTSERILRHQKMRFGKGFETFELAICDGKFSLAPLDLSAKNEAFSTVLVEDFGNLVARTVFSSKTDSDFALDKFISKTTDFLFGLSQKFENVVAVTNEIFFGGNDFSDFYMETYAKTLSAVNRNFAEKCEKVFQVVAGIPVELK